MYIYIYIYIYIYVHIDRDDVFIHNVHVTKSKLSPGNSLQAKDVYILNHTNINVYTVYAHIFICIHINI